MIERLAAWLRGQRMPDIDRATAAETRELDDLRRDAADPKLKGEQKKLAALPADSITVGEMLGGGGQPFLVSGKDLLSAHLWVTGGSGAGKTFLVILVLMALLRRGVRGITLLDMKGELSELLLGAFLPAWLSGLTTSERDAVLRDLVVVDPFGKDALPALNVVRRDPALPVEVQAFDLASCFETAVDAAMGIRMDTILDWTLRLALDQGVSFVGLRRMLEENFLLEALVRRTADRDIKRYFLTRYASEPQASRLSLLARLDRFLALPGTRLSLSAPSCLDFDAILGRGITVVNLGNAPAGCEDIAKFWATVILTKLVRAIFRRDSSGKVPPALLIADEWQEALTKPLAEQFERVLALARSRQVFLWLVNQQIGQIQKVSGSLKDVLLGNAAVQVLFRATIDDARAMRHLLPVTGREGRPPQLPWERQGGGPFLSPAEELDARVAEVAQLPERVGYFWDRRKPWRAVRFRTATVDRPDPKRLPADLVSRVRRGSFALPVVDLEAAARAEAGLLDALVRSGVVASASPDPDPQATPPGRGRRRRRQGNGKLPNLG